MINKKQQIESDFSSRERVNAWIVKNWKLLISVIAVIILIMVGIMIQSFVQDNEINSSAELAEDIQKLYDDWISKELEDRDDDELLILIDKALTEYSQHFAAKRALFTRSKMAYEKENWDDAAEGFIELADRWPRSYLAPVCLFNSASANEQAGNIEAAKQTLSRMIELYAETSPLIPEVYFNLGRIAENEVEIDTALVQYNEIISQFPESRWTDLSRNRILILEGQLQGVE